MKEFKPAILFIIAGAAITISAGIQMFKLMDSIKQPVKTVSQQTRVTERIEPKVTKEQGVNDFPEVEGNLAFNNVIDYDNLTKDDIYNLRKKYVSSSLFASSDYEPSDKVFGQIASKKPWYGLDYSGCITVVRGQKEVTQGPSEESRFINNPNMLVGVMSGSKMVEKSDPVCFDKSYWILPVKLSYFKDENTIEAVYDFRYSGSMYMVGLNARDLGYKYVYAVKVENVRFKSQTNISNTIYEFKDFIHLGSSCGYNDGCNNGSPYQSELDYKYLSYPSTIELKLWKNKPAAVRDRADINYRIIFK